MLRGFLAKVLHKSKCKQLTVWEEVNANPLVTAPCNPQHANMLKHLAQANPLQACEHVPACACMNGGVSGSKALDCAHM